MTFQHGRALRFLALFLMLWVASRAVLILSGNDAPAVEALIERTAAMLPGGQDRASPVVHATPQGSGSAFVMRIAPPVAIVPGKSRPVRSFRPPGPAALIWAEALREPAMSAGQAVLYLAPSPSPVVSETPPGIFQTRRTAASPFSVYGYAFYRPGANGESAIAQTRYGGTQAGAVAAYRINRPEDQRVDLLGRVSYSPDDPNSLEFGAGLRWQPGRSLPISVATEYRRRVDGTGTAIIYAAGGIDRQPLAADFTLSAYGQAGIFEQDGVHGFFDAQASVLRPAGRLGPIAVEAGAGAWAGGTDAVHRLDIGPRLSFQLKTGGAPVTLAADYRFRIAGDAAPGDGPAITVSTGF